jgi:chemotaxis protein methyltransferase CheR
MPESARSRHGTGCSGYASSTGQEALSIAMLIEEWADKNKSPVTYQISGTDISERALRRAKSAIYTDLEAQRGLPPDFKLKYFERTERDKWTAIERLRKHIKFKSGHFYIAATLKA